jgi:hypothetical protein
VCLWPRVCWLTYGAIVIYLLCFVVRLLCVLRRDPRSRLTAELFVIAGGLGLVSFAALLTRIIIDRARYWTARRNTAPAASTARASDRRRPTNRITDCRISCRADKVAVTILADRV